MKPGIDSLCTREIPFPKGNDPHVLPIFESAAFDFETIDQGIRIFTGEERGYVYSRYGNPTVETAARKIAMLESAGMEEEAEALMVCSGMAAISTLILALLKPGDTLLTQGNIYGGTTELFQSFFRKFDIDVRDVDLKDFDSLERIQRDKRGQMAIFFESPSNPNGECVDISAICNLARKYGSRTIVDNTVCTPYLQRPFGHGADFIIHSTTKYLNGHGNATGGVILSRDRKSMRSEISKARKLLGTNPGPIDTWLLYNGMKTLHLRMKKHCENATELAHFLEDHPKVRTVRYPGLPSHPDHKLAASQMDGFGGILSFEVDGTLEDTKHFLNRLEFCNLTPTLGDVDTLVLHPFTSSHLRVSPAIREKYGITPQLVRVSVGIEDPADIREDIDKALQQI